MMHLPFAVELWWKRTAFRNFRQPFLAGLAEALQAPKSSTIGLLAALADRTPNQAVASAYRLMLVRLGKGMTIGAALAPFYPREERGLIAAADESASTDQERGRNLAAVAKLMGGMAIVRSGLVGVVAQAAGALVVICFVWLGLGLHIGSEFGRALPREKWPELSRYVIEAGEAIVSSWPVAFAALVGVILSVLWILPNWTGPVRRWADNRVPGFVLYRTLRAAPRLLTLGGYLGAGLGFRGALSQLIESANPWERMYLEQMAARLKSRLSVDIVDVGFFSWESMVQVDMRSQGGEVAAAMQEVAISAFPIIERTLVETTQRAKRIVATLQMAVVGLVVLAVAMLYSAAVTSFGASF